MAGSRFRNIGKTRARLTLAGFALIVVVAALLASHARPPRSVDLSARPTAAHDVTVYDHELYERIVDAVAAGEPYEQAAVRLNLANRYPVRPFYAVRLPTLTWLLVTTGRTGGRMLLVTLAVALCAAWTLRLRHVMPGATIVLVPFVTLCSAARLVSSQMTVSHEAWAGVLVGLSLALRTKDGWILSVLLGLAAMLFRETAAPYAVIMAGFAFAGGRGREAAGWIAALATLGVALLVHAHAVDAITSTGDLHSRGWWGMEGIGFYLRSVILGVPMFGVDPAIGGALVAMSLLGWASLAGPVGSRMLVLQVAYVPALAICARADDWYWAGIIQYVLPIGLPLAGVGFLDLVVAAGRSAPIDDAAANHTV